MDDKQGKAGKIADTKGNSNLFYVASVLLVTSFILLSSFAGVSSIIIAVFLIFGNVGQTFMLIAMSNTISQTLPKEQTGVGMGMLSMLNFIAGAISASTFSKVVDRGSQSHWNPGNLYPEAVVYSNIYLVMTCLHVIILLLYIFQFTRAERKSSQLKIRKNSP